MEIYFHTPLLFAIFYDIYYALHNVFLHECKNMPLFLNQAFPLHEGYLLHKGTSVHTQKLGKLCLVKRYHDLPVIRLSFRLIEGFQFGLEVNQDPVPDRIS